MKCIEKAMTENRKKAKRGWWGFVKDDKRYLCRYNHIFGIFSDKSILYLSYETRTDFDGVMCAVEFYNKMKI
jgi:hypothetical protein